MNKELSFDKLFHYICARLPYIGPSVGKYYKKHHWFQRFAKFGVSTFIVFWLVKGPLIWLLTTIGMWYILSAFISGLIVTVIGFIVNEVWIWSQK